MFRGVLAVGVVLAGGCFFNSDMLRAKGLSAQQSAERRAAVTLMPAPIVQPGVRTPPKVRQLAVRVWADESYRRGRMHWREHVNELFGRANEFLAHAFGVELVADVRPWDRGADTADLETLLYELSAMDPGDGAEYVVGLTGSLSKVSATHEQLGRAWMMEKHMVMRGMNDALEREQLAAAFPTLGKDELNELHGERTVHKEIAVLVHEWAHNLGAMHEDGKDLLMAPGYSTDASHFSEENLKLVTLSLAARAGDAAAAAALRKHVETAEADWDPRDRALVLRTLAQGGMVASVPAASGSAGGAGAAPDRSISEALEAAEGHRQNRRWREGLSRLDEVRGALRDRPYDWLMLAQAYARLGAYTRADEALARAGAGPEVEKARAAIALARRQRGTWGVPADDEPEATAAVEDAHEILFGDETAAKGRIDAGLKRWPRLAGMLALRCGLELQAGRRKVAEQVCARALAVNDETMMAHFFAGHAAVRAKKPAQAAVEFRRTIELDPDAKVAYEALAQVFKDGGDQKGLDEVRERYRAQFHQTLK